MGNLQTIDIVIIVFSIICLLIWIILYLIGLKHNKMFDILDEKDYPLKEIYGMGYGVLLLINYKYKSKFDRKLRPQLEILYGTKYCDYYLRVIHSQQITISLTIFILSFVFYGLSSEIAALIVCFVFSGLAYYYFGTVTQNKILKRSDQLLSDFSEVISQLTLLTSAGMIMREALQEIADTGEGVLYDELRIAVDEMNNGVSEIDALYNFGSRCIIPEIKKFTSTIIQGMTKGNKELTMMLNEQSKEVWQLKKQLVRRKGEKAASKLLIPICIMFIGVLIMIIIPIFTNLGA